METNMQDYTYTVGISLAEANYRTAYVPTMERLTALRASCPRTEPLALSMYISLAMQLVSWRNELCGIYAESHYKRLYAEGRHTSKNRAEAARERERKRRATMEVTPEQRAQLVSWRVTDKLSVTDTCELFRAKWGRMPQRSFIAALVREATDGAKIRPKVKKKPKKVR